MTKSVSLAIDPATAQPHHRPQSSHHPSSSSVEEDLTAAASNSALPPPDWKPKTKTKTTPPASNSGLPSKSSGDEISPALVHMSGGDQAGKLQLSINPHEANTDHPILDIEDLTKEAMAMLSKGDIVGALNATLRVAAFTIAATLHDPKIIFPALGITALLQYPTTYASIVIGQISEKILTGEKQSNVEADIRKNIMSIREVVAILAQMMAVINSMPKESFSDSAQKAIMPLACLTAGLHSFMVVVDGVMESRQAHHNVKKAYERNNEEYHWRTDKELMGKLLAIIAIGVSGAVLVGISFVKPKESQLHQWLFIAGVALLGANVTGGVSVVADHLKQTNRGLRFGKAQKSWVTKFFELLGTARAYGAPLAPIISLLGENAVGRHTVTTVTGSVNTAVAAGSSLLRTPAYRETAQAGVKERGSGINRNTRETLDNFDATVLGKVTKPLTKPLKERAKITGTNEEGNVLPRGWTKKRDPDSLENGESDARQTAGDETP